MREVKEVLDILESMNDGIVKSTCMSIFEAIHKELLEMPAAVKHHHAYPGGFYQHVKEVMNITVEMYELHPEWYELDRDSIICCAFIHDLDKLNRYRRIPAGDWRLQPQYRDRYGLFEYNKDKVYVNATAETATFVASHGMLLTPVMLNVITYHHGHTSPDAEIGIYEPTRAALLLHTADMFSVNLDKGGIKL